VIVTDATGGWEARNWTLESLAARCDTAAWGVTRDCAIPIHESASAGQAQPPAPWAAQTSALFHIAARCHTAAQVPAGVCGPVERRLGRGTGRVGHACERRVGYRSLAASVPTLFVCLFVFGGVGWRVGLSRLMVEGKLRGLGLPLRASFSYNCMPCSRGPPPPPLPPTLPPLVARAVAGVQPAVLSRPWPAPPPAA